MPANLSTSVTIDAPPSAVWAVVSDLKRMGEWSPQCRKVIVRGGGPIAKGTKMVNVNREGLKVWPTQSMVTEFEPDRAIAFRVRENKAIWRFDLEPAADGGTKLTETRDVTNGTTAISHKLIDAFLGGEARFEADLVTGMKQTLAKIKAEVEKAPARRSA
ncbi:SRPBCC family protein [Calidifontibacter sp. DB0510]|uniref:SRPBCC family protein n=1 Tax=Metallococcus carri TaxID=1656884 RepID=A0A967B263_9MICO|nr:SRPBCC family protein [Metallococcus carri]NHN56015.1 SRPBCC family protein [Metallococcus carri]NOP37528.1 SRPBCC family protein [Calidifontibacter sp. DB2511S]